jgi:hypothetical protein
VTFITARKFNREGCMNKIIIFVAITVVFISSFAWASATKRLDPGTQTCRVFTPVTIRDGREIFKNSCKKCHYRGNDQKASFIHSESKIMRGWNRVFMDEYPQCAKNGEWDHLSQEDLLRLNDYLYRFAADSYDPWDAADCG